MRRVVIEAAKSSKSICKNCKSAIDANLLRVKVVDST